MPDAVPTAVPRRIDAAAVDAVLRRLARQPGALEFANDAIVATNEADARLAELRSAVQSYR